MKKCQECGVIMSPDEPGEEHEECPPGCEWNGETEGVLSFCNEPGGDMIGEYSYCVVHGQEIRMAS